MAEYFREMERLPMKSQKRGWKNSPAGKTSIDQHQNQYQNTTYAGLAGDSAYVVFW